MTKTEMIEELVAVRREHNFNLRPSSLAKAIKKYKGSLNRLKDTKLTAAYRNCC